MLPDGTWRFENIGVFPVNGLGRSRLCPDVAKKRIAGEVILPINHFQQELLVCEWSEDFDLIKIPIFLTAGMAVCPSHELRRVANLPYVEGDLIAGAVRNVSRHWVNAPAAGFVKSAHRGLSEPVASVQYAFKLCLWKEPRGAPVAEVSAGIEVWGDGSQRIDFFGCEPDGPHENCPVLIQVLRLVRLPVKACQAGKEVPEELAPLCLEGCVPIA